MTKEWRSRWRVNSLVICQDLKPFGRSERFVLFNTPQMMGESEEMERGKSGEEEEEEEDQIREMELEERGRSHRGQRGLLMGVMRFIYHPTRSSKRRSLTVSHCYY